VIPADSPKLPMLTERGATTDDSARPVAFADGHVDVVAGDRLRKMVHQHETAN
jgi:prepilin-type processing-associated H-X9-DG protein